MKCVKKFGTIRRVSDSEASKLVYNEGWSYCPKAEWKAAKKEKGKKKAE